MPIRRDTTSPELIERFTALTATVPTATRRQMFGFPICHDQRQHVHAAGTPVNLRDTLTGIDHRNTQLLITAILHATGQRPSPEIP